MGTSSAPPKHGPTCATPPNFAGTGPKQQLAEAKSTLVAYVSAIAAHHYDTAEAAILPCKPGQRTSLTKLWKFMAGMPAGKARIKATVKRGKPWPGTATADVTLYVRFGERNTSVWVKAARRQLLLHRRGAHWTITADLTRKNGGDLAAYGFASYERPTFLNGRRATVVYSAASFDGDAQAILHTADAAVGPIWRRFADRAAPKRPLIFLVLRQHQGERLAHITLGKVRSFAGWEYSSFTYVNLPAWENLDDEDQQSMIVHELTHVATRSWLDKAPHSLVEGIAMYEENDWRREHHMFPIGYDQLGLVYREGLPTIELWRRLWTDWGLASPLAIHYAYLDAMAMVETIVDRHGGVPALKRLAAAFRARSSGDEYSAADVESAFSSALGVSFSQVAAEAQARVGG
jgi:hypothetical protein